MFYIFIYLCEKYFSMRLSKDNPFQMKLLPPYFKKIAIGLFIFIAIGLIVFKYSEHLFVPYKTIGKTFLKTIGLLSLLMYILSREKDEDEMIKQIRLFSFATSFAYMVILLIISPYINILFGDPFKMNYSATQIILNGLLFYILMYHIRKFKLKQ